MSVSDVLECSEVAHPARDAEGTAACGDVETVLLSASGELFLCGRIDDRSSPLQCVRIIAPGRSETIRTERVGRFTGVNMTGGSEPAGVWATTSFDASDLAVLGIEFVLTDGQTISHEVRALRCDDEEFVAHLAAFSGQLSEADRNDSRNAEPLERLQKPRAPTAANVTANDAQKTVKRRDTIK